jgi:hypothetical protein
MLGKSCGGLRYWNMQCSSGGSEELHMYLEGAEHLYDRLKRLFTKPLGMQ